jgi:hypothetical protein
VFRVKRCLTFNQEGTVATVIVEVRRTLKKSKKTIILRKRKKEAKKTWHEALLEFREKLEAKNT